MREDTAPNTFLTFAVPWARHFSSGPHVIEAHEEGYRFHMSWQIKKGPRHVRLWGTREDTACTSTARVAFAFAFPRRPGDLELARLLGAPAAGPLRRRCGNHAAVRPPRAATGRPRDTPPSVRRARRRCPAAPPPTVRLRHHQLAHRQHRELPRRPDVGPSRTRCRHQCRGEANYLKQFVETNSTGSFTYFFAQT